MREGENDTFCAPTPARRILAFVPAAVLMAVIFYFSAQPADESSEVSEFLGIQFFTAANDLFGFGWSSQAIGLLSLDAQHVIRKIAHFLEYMLLAGFLFHGFRVNLPMGEVTGKRWRLWGIAALLTGTLYAVSDEVHQLFVAGRSGMPGDVLIDSAGVLSGVLFAALFYTMRMRKHQMRRSKDVQWTKRP